MKNKAEIYRAYPDLDILKFVMAYVVMARHLTQNFSTAGSLPYVLIVNTITVIGVPTFFVISAFLFYRLDDSGKNHLFSQIKRILLLYLVWSFIYLPRKIQGIRNSGDIVNGVLKYFQNAVFSGTYYHLWYLPALAAGFCVVFLLNKAIRNKTVLFIIVLLLFLIGLFGDSWFCWTAESVKHIYSLYNKVFISTRNGLFFAPVFIYMGLMIAAYRKKISVKIAFFICMAGAVLLVLESWLLYCTQANKTNNMMLATLLISPALVIFCIQKRKKHGMPYLHQASTIIFCVHPLVIKMSQLRLSGYSDTVKIIFVSAAATCIGFVIPLLSKKVKVLSILY